MLVTTYGWSHVPASTFEVYALDQTDSGPCAQRCRIATESGSDSPEVLWKARDG